MTSETKRQRFQRLAEKRTNDVLERLRILGNCANRGQYEYTPEEVRVPNWCQTFNYLYFTVSTGPTINNEG